MKKLARLAAAMLFAGVMTGNGHSAELDAMVRDCEGCHGANGVSQWSDVPTIAGLSAGVHADFLYTYRDRGRPCTKSKYRQGDTKRPETDMCAVATILSDAQIDSIAAYFAKRPFVKAKQTFDAAKAAAGAKLHRRDCENCHSKNGNEPGDDASILAGQWMPFLRQAFAEYASGKRPQPKKMAEKLRKLSPSDVEALVHFYASVP
jgi:cytochrome subunit of sulfide dehydrogenase